MVDDRKARREFLKRAVAFGATSAIGGIAMGEENDEKADLILRNGRIATPNATGHRRRRLPSRTASFLTSASTRKFSLIKVRVPRS